MHTVRRATGLAVIVALACVASVPARLRAQLRETPTVPIEVAADAASGDPRPLTVVSTPQKLDTLATRPGFARNQRVRDLLGLDTIQRFVVTTYSTSVVESPDTVRRMLTELMTFEISEPVLSAILWSEFTFWSIDARIEFRDGGRGRLVTDGWHGMFEEPDGSRWFFRARRAPIVDPPATR